MTDSLRKFETLYLRLTFYGLVFLTLFFIGVGRGDFLLKASPLINIFLTLHQDIPWLIALCVVLLLLRTLIENRHISRLMDALSHCTERWPLPVLWITVIVLAVCMVGVHLIYHDYALSMDEFMQRVQAKIISGGHLLAPIADFWDPLAKALQPIFMRYDPANQLWAPVYRPGGAMITAVFDQLGLGSYTAGILAAGCIPLIYALTKKIFPDVAGLPAASALLLATTPQFLLTAMTPYAMTGHLLFNLLWLYFFLRDDRFGYIAAALAGFIAAGLHQVYVHFLFIFPFMLVLLRQRRWNLIIGYAVWYAFVFSFWISCFNIATWMQADANQNIAANTAGAGLLETDFFARQVLPLISLNYVNLIYLIINLIRFLAWQNPATVLLALIAIWHMRDAPQTLRLLGWSMLLNIVAHLILMPSQGHGWGYRYLHVHLGTMVLFAAFGWQFAMKHFNTIDKVLLKQLVTVMIIMGAAGLGLRMAQIEQFVRPFAASSTFIEQLDRDLVFVDNKDVWFGVDLVRNDPYLRNRPKVLALSKLDDKALAYLCTNYTTIVVDYDSLAPFGMTRMPRDMASRQAAREELAERLVKDRCTTYR